MFEGIFLFLMLVGFFILMVSCFKWRRYKEGVIKKLGEEEKIELALEKLNIIWRDKEKVELIISDLARIWRSYEEQERELISEVIEFRNDDVMEFYLVYLRGRVWFSGKVREIIIDILRILDEKGDCSSVVSGRNESYELDKSLYDLLSEISLREHSLRVARKCFEFGVSGLSEPKVVISALAHDLGKIPEYHKEFYSLGDHPVISVQVLRGIRWFKDLSYAEEIERAILYHHKTGKGELVEILKKADAGARREEVDIAKERKRKREKEKVLKELIESTKRNVRVEEEVKEEVKEEKEEVKVELEEKIKERVEEKVEEGTEGGEERRQKVGEKKVRRKVFEVEDEGEMKIYEYDLSWLPVEEFINILRSEVNRVKNDRWIAFSMPNGVVYVHPTGLWQILRKVALKVSALDIITMEEDKNLRRSVLASLVELLREKGYIEEELIQKGYFSAPFLVYRKEGEPIRVLYTPFKAEKLGNDDLSVVSEFERLKKGTIIEMIERVEPDFSEFAEEN